MSVQLSVMKAFEKVMQKVYERNNKPVHTVVQYNYSMEQSRENVLVLCRQQKTLSFEKLFEHCENRIHAIFSFLSMLELVQQLAERQQCSLTDAQFLDLCHACHPPESLSSARTDCCGLSGATVSAEVDHA